MQQVEKLESMIARWMKDLPHLPKEFTKWLAENSWWLTIIGVVVGGLGLLGALSALTVGSAMLGALGAPALGGMLFVSSLVSLAGAAVAVVIEAMAISPLKSMMKKGWDMLFLAVLVSFAGAVVSSVLGANFVGILMAAVGAAIACYVLLEVKSYFGAKAKAVEKPAA